MFLYALAPSTTFIPNNLYSHSEIIEMQTDIESNGLSSFTYSREKFANGYYDFYTHPNGLRIIKKHISKFRKPLLLELIQSIKNTDIPSNGITPMFIVDEDDDFYYELDLSLYKNPISDNLGYIEYSSFIREHAHEKKLIRSINNAIRQLVLILNQAGIYHGDMHGGNILIHPKSNHIALIDWEFIQIPSTNYLHINPNDILHGNTKNVEWVDLSGQDLRDIELSTIRIGNTTINFNLIGATFEESIIDRGNFQYADLRYSSFRNVSGEHSIFRSANLTFADLSGANLTYSNLRWAQLDYANLDKTDLRGADLSNTSLGNAYANNLIIDHTTILFDTEIPENLVSVVISKSEAMIYYDSKNNKWYAINSNGLSMNSQDPRFTYSQDYSYLLNCNISA